jgi:hypothetical protein
MMRKTIGFVVGLILALAVMPLASQAAPLHKLSWQAEYYDNPSLAGTPALILIEHQLSHDWGYGSPAPELPSDHFSARWTDERYFTKGSYLFVLNVNDGARVWFDGQLIIDAWSTGTKERRARIRLETDGDHEIQVAYFEDTGKAAITLESFQLAEGNEVAGAWDAEYFINTNLAGEPTLERQDGAIDFDWNGGAPDPRITRDNFSVRWTRQVLVEAGPYLFTIQHDDGMRIYIDGKIFYDAWYDQPVSYNLRRVNLLGGYRTLTVEYYEHLGNATARVSVEPDFGDHSENDVNDSDVGTIVDNTHGSFRWNGPKAYRYTSPDGYGGDFYWTYNTPAGASINSGTWSLPLGDTGNYEVFAYIPGQATAGSARYAIQHHGEWHERIINQGLYSSEWVSLGIYYFDANDASQFVRLYDDTQEPGGSTKVAFDAIKLVRR